MSHEVPSHDPTSDLDDPSARVGILTVVLLYAVFAALWILLSDKAVEWLWTDPAQIALVSTLKGWAFVAVTSLLLYGLMRRLLGSAGATRAPVAGTRPMVLPLALFTLAVVAMTGGGIAHTVIHRKDTEVARLQAIADLKVRQIADWLGERYGDARFVQTSRFWITLYRRWRDDGDAGSLEMLQWRLSEFLEYNSFQGAIVLDEQYAPVWSSEEAPITIDPALRDAARQAAHNNRVIHLGPYRDAVGRLHLDFIAPLPAMNGRPGPFIILRIDPASHLFPTLKTWPVPSASGETLLFRSDGGHVLYLNELRHRADTAVKLRVPVTEEKLPAGRILRQEAKQGSLVEGLDYRGVPVMAVVRGIHGTDWFLAAKLDRTELYAETVGDVLWIALAGLLSLFMAATGAFVFRQRQDLAVSLHERGIQAERLRVLQLLDAIAESSADAIFAKDVDGRYLLFNREAARVTGKKSQEVLGRDDTEVFPPEQAALIMANDRQVMTDNRSVTFLEDLTTADGEISFLATKGPLHDAAGNVIGMFGISRDITERKRAEKERELAVDFLRLVNESSHKEGMIRAATTFFQQRSGCDAVGIRLKDGDDYPYCEARGFPADFILAESSLCARYETGEVLRDSAGYPILECMCGNIIRGRFDPLKPFFTGNGSFWTNNTTELLATTTEVDRQARTRNRCNGEGYESVALIPLRVGDDRLGLLQLNDRREGRFSLEDVALWERLAGYLAVALAKFHAEGLRRESEERLRAIIDNAESIIWFKDLEGRFLIVNRYTERVLGKPADQLVGRTVFDLFPRDLAKDYSDNDRRVIDAGEAMEAEESARFEDGPHTFLSVKFPVRDPGGVIYGLGAICTDITERKRAEELLRHQEMMLREAGEIAHVGGWEFDPVTFEGNWTEETARIHDVDPEAVPDATQGLGFFHGESRTRIEAAVKEAIEIGKPYDLELELISAKGTHKWVRTICHPVVEKGRVVRVRGSLQDITERRRAEEALRDSLEEKVALLKEVHHRVKNNLQIVASLLSLQASRTPNREVADVLHDTRNRVRSMALLHEALYRSGNLARINFAAYVGELCVQLLRSFGSTASGVKVENHVAPFGLALEQAVPCGLIISELVSNSLKHGFPEGRCGRVAVELRSDDGQRLVLCVSDDGVGLQPGFDPAATFTLGLKLVSNLASQLGGELVVERPTDGGVAFRVIFPVPKDTPH